jgi:hypothetical protein
MQEILVAVSPEGKVTISTKGFVGKACKDATKQMEKALGVVVKDTDTPEMHQTVQTAARARG